MSTSCAHQQETTITIEQTMLMGAVLSIVGQNSLNLLNAFLEIQVS